MSDYLTSDDKSTTMNEVMVDGFIKFLTFAAKWSWVVFKFVLVCVAVTAMFIIGGIVGAMTSKPKNIGGSGS